MHDDRLARTIDFVVELDKLKHVLRQTTLMDGSRRENSAEHSWHLAMMALVLAEFADEPLDIARVIAMVLVHDLVEIDAGDTFCYDEQGVLDQAAREQQAADRLFSMLPPDHAAHVHELWREFEARESGEARFAVALDRMQPMLQNLRSAGGTWKQHGITLPRVQARMAPVAQASSRLGAYVRDALADALAQGYIREA